MMEWASLHVTCSRRLSYYHCFQAIDENKADAMLIEHSLLFDALQHGYRLRPLVAEVYGTKEQPRTHYYAVALARKGSKFQMNQLRGLRSCHTGFNTYSGWTRPINVLQPYLNWTGKPETLESTVSKFFSASCVPCVDEKKFPTLCSLCVGKGPKKCVCSTREPYFGFQGAFKCLKNEDGDVAFVRDTTVFDALPNQANRAEYELLCPDNTRKSVDKFRDCNLGRAPAFVVVGRTVNGKEDLIWELLQRAQESNLYKTVDSEGRLKELLFTKSAIGFMKIPQKVDIGLYLSFGYLDDIRSLTLEPLELQQWQNRIMWCAVGDAEMSKCEKWSKASKGKVLCEWASSPEECITKLKKGDADAVTLDGGLVHIAGKCGLVPVLAESTNPQNAPDCVEAPAEGYFSVAVVRKSDPDITWKTLKGTKSCHTVVDSSEGWNIPLNQLLSMTGECQLGSFFNESCVPGSDPKSNLCALCVGNNAGQHKCAPNSEERYYGDSGALRCLAEKAGDIAFVTDITVLHNTNGRNTEVWAQKLLAENFELLCPDSSRKPVTEAASCHLGRAPSHAVVSRKDKAELLERVLLKQLAQFGKGGTDCPGKFCLFKSETKNLLFNDNTICLAKLQNKKTYDKFLGAEYIKAISNIKKCSYSGLLEACEFLSS
ncbi:lactotransferrin [Erinaceus europaeus]|uniref:Lactotransferrin n=1 Tax=Erinaceus europaeus TaxID=9365 RepID=A0ABM3YID6_ERIEU|nr:lactotransferrin [Erinaceus europaeus]